MSTKQELQSQIAQVIKEINHQRNSPRAKEEDLQTLYAGMQSLLKALQTSLVATQTTNVSPSRKGAK